jgi:hypothetical protein
LVELALEDGSISCGPGTEQANQNPSRAYLNLIIEGVTNYGLDAAWVEKLKGIPTR